MTGPVSRYLGNETITNFYQAVQYLMDNYVKADGTVVTEPEALAACDTHHDKIAKGINPFRSNVYYVGDEIGRAMGWTELPEPEECEEDPGEEE